MIRPYASKYERAISINLSWGGRSNIFQTKKSETAAPKKISGNAIFSDYLNIIFLPGSGELTVFVAALIGASLGFLWFNFYPAQVFMGDTGSLALGGAFGILTVLIKKELLIPILGGIFFMETLSVIIQRLYFKYTKKVSGEGKRVFKMAPIHHHFEIKGWSETKIMIRFWIVAGMLAGAGFILYFTPLLKG